MKRLLFILNDAPYGSERSYNGLRLAGEELIEGSHRSTLDQLADWTSGTDQILVF